MIRIQPHVTASFVMFGSLIEPLNQIVTATIQVNHYQGKRSDYFRDEIRVLAIRDDFPAKGFVEVIIPYSKPISIARSVWQTESGNPN
jgi:hypothetical protein